MDALIFDGSLKDDRDYEVLSELIVRSKKDFLEYEFGISYL